MIFYFEMIFFTLIIRVALQLQSEEAEAEVLVKLKQRLLSKYLLFNRLLLLLMPCPGEEVFNEVVVVSVSMVLKEMIFHLKWDSSM